MATIEIVRGTLLVCAGDECRNAITILHKDILPRGWAILRENGNDNAYCPNCDGKALAKYNPATVTA